MCGFSCAITMTYTMYIRPIITPGITAPMNRSPTDSDSWSAMMTSMMLGGIRMPSVPAPATTPEASSFE